MTAPLNLYQGHRAVLLENLRAQGAAALIFTNEIQYKSRDSEQRFRPGSDFFYLTGFDEPQAALVLLPGRDAGESVLFLMPKEASEERWSGPRLGLEHGREWLGVDETRSFERLWADLPGLLRGYSRIVYGLGEQPERDRSVQELLARLRQGSRDTHGSIECLDPLDWVHEQRVIKGTTELELLSRAARISAEAHLNAMRLCRPGLFEAELEAELLAGFLRRGAREAYLPMVAGGARACQLHYSANNRKLEAGQLVLIDAGAEVNHYAADITRTLPVDGRFSAEQLALYQVVRRAQAAALATLRPGQPFDAADRAAKTALAEGLIDLGLLDCGLEQALEGGQLRRFCWHKSCHFLGLDVHDPGRTELAGRPRALEAGMVLAVEPGLYIAPDDASVAPRWRGLAVRIEDDGFVSRDGFELLTFGAPRDPEDVSAACLLAELGGR